MDVTETKRLPVTLLSGFLGAGKTTLMQHILKQQKARVAVIVNDMSEINIDAELIASGQASFKRGEEKLVEMSNGCICCTLREDLLQEVAQLARQGRFDYLLIESTGISEPLPVAETFAFEDEAGQSLSEISRLDTLVTVVDASRFEADFNSLDELPDRNMGLDDDDVRSIVELLVDQIEFANVLLLNKIDAVSEETAERIMALLKQLNPTAKVIPTHYAEVDLKEILNTGAFERMQLEDYDEWLARPREEVESEKDLYGIDSFVYRARRPFHIKRLLALFEQGRPELLRSKGIVWVASRHNIIGQWSQAGQLLSLSPAGYWWATAPREEWLLDAEASQQVLKDWQEPWGDRRTELVMIGQSLDQQALISALNGCLLTDAEMALGPEAWENFEDPLGPWIMEDLMQELSAVP